MRMASGKHITLHIALSDRRTVKKLEELCKRNFCCHSPRRQLLLHNAELLPNDMQSMRLQPPLDLTLVLIDFIADQVDKLTEAAAAGDFHQVQQLLQHFQDPNQTDSAGRTALHRASASGEVKVAKLLVEDQAELDKVDCEGWTSLHFAVFYDQPTSIEFLLQKSADNPKYSNVAQTPVELAAIYDTNIVRLLLLSSLRPPSQRTASARAHLSDGMGCLEVHGRPSLLHYMIIHGHDEKVCQMLHVVSEMSHPYDDASEPHLFFEWLWGVTSAGSILWDDWWESVLHCSRVVECLVNLDDWVCKTPLHHASMLGRQNILALLLKHNANIHMTDGDCLAPLHHAAICADGETCLEVLLQTRACVNQLDHQKMTPLHHAALRGHRNHAQILLEARHQECLVNLDDWTCKTPLHHAAMLGRGNILALLLKHNATFT